MATGEVRGATDAERGRFRWAAQQFPDAFTSGWSAVSFGIVAFSFFVALVAAAAPAARNLQDRAASALVAALVACIATAITAFGYYSVVAPRRQRNVLRAEVRQLRARYGDGSQFQVNQARRASLVEFYNRGYQLYQRYPARQAGPLDTVNAARGDAQSSARVDSDRRSISDWQVERDAWLRDVGQWISLRGAKGHREIFDTISPAPPAFSTELRELRERLANLVILIGATDE